MSKFVSARFLKTYRLIVILTFYYALFTQCVIAQEKQSKKATVKSPIELAVKDSIVGLSDTAENKKRLILHYFHEDSLKRSARIYSWALNEKSYAINYIRIDTLPYDFARFYPNLKKHISNSWLGYLGSASISNNYFEQELTDRFLFTTSYKDYLVRANQIRFYDTKKPFTRFNYSTAGQKNYAEQTLGILHTQNVNRWINVGFHYDLLSYKGLYSYNPNLGFNIRRNMMSNSRLRLFGSYIRKNYALQLAYVSNNIEGIEKGGLFDDEEIEDQDLRPQDIENALDFAYSTTNENSFIVNQKYRFLFNRKVNLGDTLEVFERVPFLEVGHNFSIRRSYRKYTESQISGTDPFYENNYISSSLTRDTAFYRQFKNSFIVSFPGLYKANFDAKVAGVLNNYIENYYYFEPDHYLTSGNNETTFDNSVSGLLFASHKSGLKLKGELEFFFSGYRIGDLDFKSNLTKSFALFDNKNNFIYAGFDFNKHKPTYLYSNYFSNHYRWNNLFSDESNTVISGGIMLGKLKTNLELRYGLTSNYLYLNENAIPDQKDGFLNVFALQLEQKFDLGSLQSETKALYQVYSDTSVLSLPALSLVSKLFFGKELYFKSTQGRMYMEIGIDLHYNTKFYAPAYSPATGLFYKQREKEIGAYPYVDAYANMRIKRMLIFLKYEHINQYISEPSYFVALHYPRNPRIFKFGISWTFYD